MKQPRTYQNSSVSADLASIALRRQAIDEVVEKALLPYLPEIILLFNQYVAGIVTRMARSGASSLSILKTFTSTYKELVPSKY
jgi:hypothetical protein